MRRSYFCYFAPNNNNNNNNNNNSNNNSNNNNNNKLYLYIVYIISWCRRFTILRKMNKNEKMILRCEATSPGSFVIYNSDLGVRRHARSVSLRAAVWRCPTAISIKLLSLRCVLNKTLSTWLESISTQVYTGKWTWAQGRILWQ